MSDAPVVEVNRLVKRYPGAEHPAVNDISLVVRPGEIFGLLGPNGAGKSTTIGIATTRVFATSGDVLIGGYSVAGAAAAARFRLAVVPQRNNLDRALNCEQNLIFHARYFGYRKREARLRAHEVMEMLGIQDRRTDAVDSLSGGLAQRLMLARALMHEPAVLFLDEPSTGLDVPAKQLLYSSVRDLSATGTAVFVSTHDMHEAADLCETVAIIDGGELLACDSPKRLIAEHGTGVFVDVTFARAGQRMQTLGPEVRSLAESLCSEGFASFSRQLSSSRTRVYTTVASARVLGRLSDLAAGRNLELAAVSTGAVGLEDVFIDLTGRSK